MEWNRPANTTWNIIYIFAILPFKDFLPWTFLEAAILGAYQTERTSRVENGSQYRSLSCNAETKDFARLTSHPVRGWTGKNKAFCSPGTQTGGCVIKVYTKLKFVVKAIVIQSRFRRTRFRTVVNNNQQNRRKETWGGLVLSNWNIGH